MYKFIFLLVLNSGAANAQGVFYSYAEWARLSEDDRTAYVSGAMDMLTSVAAPGQRGDAVHYNNCLARSKMTNGQLATNVKEFVKSNPTLQGGTATRALMAYLIGLCGLPPTQDGTN